LLRQRSLVLGEKRKQTRKSCYFSENLKNEKINTDGLTWYELNFQLVKKPWPRRYHYFNNKPINPTILRKKIRQDT